jgi:hypothetical protein
MTTWTFKGTITLLALTALIGCDAGPAGELLSGLTRPATPKEVALETATMAAGAMTLVPPQGYCIDKRSLTSRFALMARCDVLKTDAAGLGMPIGVITVSLSSGSDSMPSPEQTATAFGLSDVSRTETSDNSVVFRATGPAPFKDMSPTQWRATARINDQLLGLAFYQPNQASAGSEAGKPMLQDLITRTAEKNS